jgi:hypothetical protein
MTLSKQQAAERMGMKPEEIVSVEETGEGVLVTTHDGVTSTLTDDGLVVTDTGKGEVVATQAEDGEPSELLREPGTVQDPVVTAASTIPKDTNVVSVPTVPGNDGPPVVEDPDGGEVPTGSIDEVLTWVGDDTDKADRALRAEQAKDKPRSTLVERLTALKG